MDVTLLGLPSIPPTHVQTHRPATHVVSLLSHLSSILYYISLTGLWNAAANHEGYDRRRNDMNTLPHPALADRVDRSPTLDPDPISWTLLWEPTCTYGGNGVVGYGGRGAQIGTPAFSTGAGLVSISAACCGGGACHWFRLGENRRI